MIINKFLPDSLLKLKEEKKREASRIATPCEFSDGITQEEFIKYANEAVDQIDEREIEIKVSGPIVCGVVRSIKGSTVWFFEVDFNDFGHITGRYWISSENNDSSVPYRIASLIEKQILIKLGVIPMNKTLSNDEYKDEEYFCPHCGAILNDQDGFDPSLSSWICTNCHKQLVGEDSGSDFFGDTVWYCDNCGAVLNDQKGFTETEMSWKCEKCGYENSITEDDIITMPEIIM